jgi:hypothetical protein
MHSEGAAAARPIAVRRRTLTAALSGRRLESAAAFAASAAIAVIASAHLLHRDVVEGDALVHQYWMRKWVDPALFTDALTAKLRGSERYPDGYQALFWLGSHVADPIVFGEWLGIALMAAAGWLVFAIVREHSHWPPAAWIAAGLFLALQGHRFFGGFPRGFLHLVVLLTVLLAIRRCERAAALVAAGGALFYPPAALLAVGVLALSSLRRRGVDAQRVRTAALALVLMLGAVLGPQLLAGASFDVMTASEAHRYPEFGPHGDLHFFSASLLDYLRQNRSGFDLRATGSLLLLAALGLLVVRRANLGLLRPEVLALPVVALAAYALAQATLFRLYLPHRYTYPLLAFCAIAIAVTLRPTWEALPARPRPRLRAFALLLAPLPLAYVALAVFPLGPMRPPADIASWAVPALAVAALALAAGVAFTPPRVSRVRSASLGALLTGLTLLAAVLALPGRVPPGQTCPRSPAMEYLATLPKDAVIAGDPMDLKCVPAAASRPVVISTQLAFSYERGYFLEGRARMFATLRAYYGRSTAALTDLRTRYGATYVLVNRRAVRREQAGERARWPGDRQPYGRLVTGLLRSAEPAVLHLPARCRRWRHGAQAVYDLRCL